MKATLDDLVPRRWARATMEAFEANMKGTPPQHPTRELFGIGATVLDSPSGPGKVEGFSRDGLPRVNHDVVRWCLYAYGPSLRVFDPWDEAPEEYRR